MTPRLVTGDDAIQKTVTFSLVLVQQVLTNLHTVFFMFLCQHSSDPPGTNFAIFQRCHHRFNALQSIFISVHCSLVVIHQFVRMS